MSKAYILIDMDGVICNWVGKLKENFEAKYPDRKMLPIEQMTKFYVEDLHAPEWKDDIKNIVYTQGFYSSLEPITGAIEALKDIENNCLDFVEPFICSSPEVQYDLQLCHSEKAAWVDAHLGKFWTKRLILTKDKTLVRGHLLIDDKPEITGAMMPTWSQIVYDQPWNKSVQGEDGVAFSWSEWPSFRDDVLAPNFGENQPRIIAPTKDSGIILLN